MTTPSQAEKAARFAKLHEAGCFVLPNAWDMPSAALIAEAGFPVVVTTSAGVAFAQGLPDGERISRDRMLGVAGEIAARIPLPVTADLEAGYGDVGETVRRAIAAGLVGCNIEDSDPTTFKLLDVEQAAARIRAGAEAARAAGLADFVLNARTDPYLTRFGSPEQCFTEAVKRSNAYLAAGARCAFVPGPVDVDTAAKLAQAIHGPLNIMGQGGGMPSVAELERAGVRRLSLGGSLMCAAYGYAQRALQEITATGRVGYEAGVGHMELVKLMGKYR
jgi:2-methylisocitrate lyase-like PEP mutase family enzyme